VHGFSLVSEGGWSSLKLEHNRQGVRIPNKSEAEPAASGFHTAGGASLESAVFFFPKAFGVDLTAQKL
jgi:hypothetical protein